MRDSYVECHFDLQMSCLEQRIHFGHHLLSFIRSITICKNADLSCLLSMFAAALFSAITIPLSLVVAAANGFVVGIAIDAPSPWPLPHWNYSLTMTNLRQLHGMIVMHTSIFRHNNKLIFTKE